MGERFMGQKGRKGRENGSIFGWMTMHKYMSIIVLLLFCVAILFTVGCSSSGASEGQKSQGNPSASAVSGGTPSAPPASAVSGEAPSTPPASAVSGEAPSTPPASAVSGGTPSTPPASTVSGGTQSKAEMAMGEASKGNRYLFLVFYKQSDQKSEAMKQVAVQAQKEVSTRADAAYIDFADKSEQTLIANWGIDESFIPITLVVAPNGAIVYAFPEQASLDDLKNAFVSPKTAEIIKASQDGKLVYLYIANSGMKYYKENLTAIQETATYFGFVQVVKVDPVDKEEAFLIELLQLKVPVTETDLFIVAGPYIADELTGKIDKETLYGATINALSSGVSGSGCLTTGGG